MRDAGQIAEQVGMTAESAMTHPQGNFVVEKVVVLGDEQDVLDVTCRLWEDPYKYTSHKHAFHKFSKIIDKMVRAGTSHLDFKAADAPITDLHYGETHQ